MKRWIICAGIILTLGLTACSTGIGGSSASGTDDQTKTVLTVGDTELSTAEARAYMYIMQKQYEYYYGTDIWDKEKSDGVSWKDWLKDQALSQTLEMQVLSTRAVSSGITLTEEENRTITEEVGRLLDTMDEHTAEACGFSEELLNSVYTKSTLAGRYYEQETAADGITLTAEEEASCRYMQVMQIFIPHGETEKEDAVQKTLAETALAEANNGGDFETISKASSPDSTELTMSLNASGEVLQTGGILEESFYKAAWALSEGEISPLVETTYGWHIIKCVLEDDTAADETAKTELLREKQQESFKNKYNEWLKDIDYQVDEAWNDIDVVREL